MAIEPNTHLATFLAQAAAANGADRIGYRDRIAAFGSDAILALEPWLADRSLATFAVLTIGKAAAVDRDTAIAVLRRGELKSGSAITKGDIRRALTRLGTESEGRTRSNHVQRRLEFEPVELSDLVIGGHYERARLHASGLGGNPQSGLSYPAAGDYALLFSNPAREGETGCHDRWIGSDGLLFYGRWDGDGDMPMNAANRKFIERSPRLHVFMADGASYRYEGRFEYVSHHLERTDRHGAPSTAIVLRLARVEGLSSVPFMPYPLGQVDD
jgi:hypothetical protein